MGFDGRIWPCCWFHDLYNGEGNPDVLQGNTSVETHHKLQELDKVYGVGWNSIFHNTWEDILGHEYYTKVLPNTFDDKNPNSSAGLINTLSISGSIDLFILAN